MAILDDDLIRDIIARVLSMSDNFTEAQAAQIEADVRHDWGGERVFVRKDSPRGQRHGPNVKRMAADEVKSGEPVERVRTKFGLSRATIYRVLNKRG